MNDEPMSAEKPPYFSAPHLELVYVTTIIFFSLCVSIFLPSHFTIMTTHLIIQKSFELFSLKIICLYTGSPHFTRFLFF